MNWVYLVGEKKTNRKKSNNKKKCRRRIVKILRKQILISPYLSFFMHRNSVLFLLHKAYSRFSLTKSILYEKRLLFPHFLYGCLLVTLKVGALEIIVTGDLHSRKSACNFRIFFSNIH